MVSSYTFNIFRIILNGMECKGLEKFSFPMNGFKIN